MIKRQLNTVGYGYGKREAVEGIHAVSYIMRMNLANMSNVCLNIPVDGCYQIYQGQLEGFISMLPSIIVFYQALLKVSLVAFKTPLPYTYM